MSARRIVIALFVSTLWPCLLAVYAQPDGEPTRILVRAVSHDAKIIGSNVGGARIVVQDVASGAILAEGLQTGSTGNTDLIMKSARARDSLVFATDGAAHFLAELQLARPTVVDITAYGPLGTPHATQMTTKRLVLVPGKHVLGEGIVLELNGFTVEILDVQASATSTGHAVDVTARVTMLCGCPTEPDGLWNSNDYDLDARLLDGDTVVTSAGLDFAGKTSTFAASLGPVPSGMYTLQVLASDAARGNFGFANRPVFVPGP
jgi:hypothetical protein